MLGVLVEIESFTLIFTDTERSLTYPADVQSYVNQMSVATNHGDLKSVKPDLMGVGVTGMPNRPANGDHDNLTSWVVINITGKKENGHICHV